MFESLLVANRGEIARRVIRTARRLNIRTVAVCSEADASAPFVREADEFHVIGPAAPKDSYLNGDKIIEVARRADAQAIHPGYGFLSENAKFAQAVADAGLTFVGPSPETIQRVGGKLDARTLAGSASVPVVPGTASLSNVQSARQAAEDMGYPVLLKASAGGGGIGMTVVESEKKLERAFGDAQKKGETFFGDGTVYMEKMVACPAHLEVQILGAPDGTVIPLGVRDCTVQRRHQKVIEETPSARLDAPTEKAMLEAAVRMGEAASYRNAGTVEMVFAGGGSDAGNFYFLEVNSRLQVEHPVTEMVTGIDLVEEQLRIAAGLAPTEAAASPRFSGHAIEARICAEDPDKRFFPSPGRLDRVSFFQGEHVRVDTGVESGTEVTPHYDSLLAKMVVWAEERDQAIQRLCTALRETELVGVKTNIHAIVAALESDAFQGGQHDTGLLRELGFRW